MNPKNKANILAKHFAKIHNTNKSRASAMFNNEVLRSNKLYFKKCKKKNVKYFKVTPNEVKFIIKNLKNNKAPGHDQIPNIAIKNLPKKVIILFAKIVSAMLTFGVFPKKWKIAKVIAFPKPGKDPSQPNNLRPISLLSTLSKVAEYVVLDKINRHIQENNIMPNEQFGFRYSHSTVHALLGITEKIRKNINKNRITTAVFLDVEKAFDKVWHNGLIYKLIKLKFDYRIVKFIANYLEDRQIYVEVDKENSEKINIKAGCPQGAILSPVLYNLYTHDIPKHNKTNLSIFADDTCIYSGRNDIVNNYKAIQEHIKILEEYYKKWKININTSKSILVNFTTKRKINNNKRILINNKVVEEKTEAKYLGMILDQKLNYLKNTDYICKKAKIAMSEIYPFLKIDNKINKKNKINIYKVFIRPIMLYGAQIWSRISKSQWLKLERIERKCLRMALNFRFNNVTKKYVSNKKVYEESKIVQLKETAKIHNKRTFTKMNTIENELIKNIKKDYNHRLKSYKSPFDYISNE